MRFMSKKMLVGAAGAALAALTGIAVAIHPATASADTEEQFSTVEDFSYPGAGQILAQQNVKLISGDGRIVLADCNNPPDSDVTFIYVYTTDLSVNGGDSVCFRVLGAPGVLTMEVPAVYEIRGDGRTAGSGDGHDITAVVKPQGGEATKVDVDSDGSTQVGVGTDPPGPPTTLLQLRVNG
jgi:hypothetical protein